MLPTVTLLIATRWLQPLANGENVWLFLLVFTTSFLLKW